MCPSSRRAVIRGLGVVALGGLAGCTVGGSDPTTQRESTDRSPALNTTARTTGTSESSTSRDYRFSFSATMLNQASTSSPPRFRVTLTNEGDSSVKIFYGQTLLFGPAGPRGPRGLVVVPSSIPLSGTRTRQTTGADECWQYGPDQTVTVQAILRQRTMPPGDTFSETFAVYDNSEPGACYPSGAHRVRDGVYLDEQDQSSWMDLVVDVVVDNAGDLSTSAPDPTPPS